MTEQHILTDEIIEEIATGKQWADNIGDVVFRHDDMRAAADWQLEQVIEWIDAVDCDAQQDTAQRLRKAMRPQENNNG